MPPEVSMDEQKNIVYNDENLQVCEYFFDEIKVWCVKHHSITIEQVYLKESLLYKNSWKAF